MTKQELTPEDLKAMAKIRWKNQDDERHRLAGIERAPLKIFEDLFFNSYENGFKCCYCGRPLRLHAQYPYYAAPSVDHRIPISNKGTDDVDNLVLCCHACNIVKGTLDCDLYEEFISIIKKSPRWKKMIEGWFLGRMANLLEGEEAFKEIKAELKTLEGKNFELECEILELGGDV